MPEETTNLPEIFQLSSIPDAITVRDMSYEFAYNRVKKPDGENSNLFTLCFRDSSNSTWHIKNGLLSHHYSVAMTEKIIENIRQQLNTQLLNQKNFRYGCIVRSAFEMAGFDLSVVGDDEVNRAIFLLFTGITSDLSFISNNKLSFNITNDFSGARRLELSYGLMKDMRCGQNADSSLKINNLFILDEYTYDLIHHTNLELNFAQISSVRRQVQSKIDLFKSIHMNAEILDDLSGILSVAMYKKFTSIYDQVHEDARTLYYITFILSPILSSVRKLNYENSCRAYIKRKVAELSGATR